MIRRTPTGRRSSPFPWGRAHGTAVARGTTHPRRRRHRVERGAVLWLGQLRLGRSLPGLLLGRSLPGLLLGRLSLGLLLVGLSASQATTQETGLLRRGSALEQSRSLLSTPRAALFGASSAPGLLEAWGQEAPVNRQQYRVGPGDELALAIGAPTDLLLPVTVSADGVLLVPTIGAIDIRGLSLSEAQERAAEQCRAAYPQASISLHLIRPAIVRLPVTGMVEEPGTYALPATARLADLISAAGGLRPSADTRRVQIHALDHTVRIADLLLWQTLGTGSGNPILYSGDRVHVPPASETYRVRGTFPRGEETVTGASLVDRPFEPRSRLLAAHEGDNLAFVLEAVGGFEAGHCEPGVWVTRARLAQGERRWVPLDQAAGFLMHPGDIVDIPFRPEWIAVAGSINHPGLYPFLAGQTVADYVFAAGGPTLTGKNNGWEIWDPVTGQRHGAAPHDSLAAGMQVWVPERRAHWISTLLTPIGTAVALVVSIVAITR